MKFLFCSNPDRKSTRFYIDIDSLYGYTKESMTWHNIDHNLSQFIQIHKKDIKLRIIPIIYKIDRNRWIEPKEAKPIAANLYENSVYFRDYGNHCRHKLEIEVRSVKIAVLFKLTFNDMCIP